MMPLHKTVSPLEACSHFSQDQRNEQSEQSRSGAGNPKVEFFDTKSVCYTKSQAELHAKE